MTVEQKQVWLVRVTVSTPDPLYPYGEAITCFDGYPRDVDLVEVFRRHGFTDALITTLLEDGTAYLVNEDQYQQTIDFGVECVPMLGLKK